MKDLISAEALKLRSLLLPRLVRVLAALGAGFILFAVVRIAQDEHTTVTASDLATAPAQPLWFLGSHRRGVEHRRGISTSHHPHHAVTGAPAAKAPRGKGDRGGRLRHNRHVGRDNCRGDRRRAEPARGAPAGRLLRRRHVGFDSPDRSPSERCGSCSLPDSACWPATAR
jgi:hypothetical protein